MAILDITQWERFLADHPDAHVLQTAAWGELKAAFGWRPVRVQAGTGGVQILFRQLPLGLTVGYVPKGPVGSGWQALWPEVEEVCRQQHAIFLKVEPDSWGEQPFSAGDGLAGALPADPIQPRRTVEVSLAGSPEDWLSRMRQKTRYNVRLAEKKEVVVKENADVAGFYNLMQETGNRDQFGVHSLAYYQRAYDLFASQGACTLLTAEYRGKPLASVMVFAHGRRAWYFYGASGNDERNRMPAYLVQFEAMRWATARGCRVYDMWGIPDVDEEELEKQFSGREDGLWGVYRFKRGFGGTVRRSSGAWDKVFQPMLYKAYRLYSRRRGGE